VLALIVAGLLAVMLAVVRPIVRMTATMRQLATGSLTTDIPFTNRGDEIGSMAAALTVFKQAGTENARLRDEQVRAEDEVAKAKQKALLGMADTVERETDASVETASKAAAEVERAASGLSEIARGLSDRSQAVAAASAQALANARRSPPRRSS